MSNIPPELSDHESAPKKYDVIEWLRQSQSMAEIDKAGTGEWTIVYHYESYENGSKYWYSGLVACDDVSRFMERPGWEVTVGSGVPSFSKRFDGKKETTVYERYGSSGIEPLVYVRDFFGLKPKQFDLSEEFRLFHNLYHDRKEDTFIHISDRGRETVACEIKSTLTRISTRLLRQYMAAKQVALVIFFDHRADARVNFDSVKGVLVPFEKVDQNKNYAYHIGDISDVVISRLIGKKIIAPPPISECGVWPFSDGKDGRFADFIIGVGEDGSQIKHSCNHENLANYFGSNPKNPNYLTPVWFRKDVLYKYYSDPGRFSVEDGSVRCGSLWGVRIDNNLLDHVVVYLGDLGRDLDYEEQLYWQHFNVNPVTGKTSDPNFRRSFLAEFADPTAPDLLFKQRYEQLREKWQSKFGWMLFRELHVGDQHIFKQLHVPASGNPGEFDGQLLFLAKLLIDSLNDGELSNACGGALPDEKSISKLNRFLEQKTYPHRERDIAFLATLQGLRSTGAAHIRGTRFDKLWEKSGASGKTMREVFSELLSNAVTMLDDIMQYFC